MTGFLNKKEGELYGDQKGVDRPLPVIDLSKGVRHHYFDLYGRGEPGRLLLFMTKTRTEDCRIESEKWLEMKDKAPYSGKGLPIVECPNNRILKQSKAWWRHIAKVKGPYPSEPDQILEHDWVIDHYYEHFEYITAI